MTWVKGRNGIHHWTGDLEPGARVNHKPVRVDHARVSQRTGFCIDCRADIEKRSVRCWACYTAHLEAERGDEKQSPQSAIDDVTARLARNLGKPYAHPPLGVICDDCGCLLVASDEPCPECLVWAIADAARASWAAATEHYTPTEMEIAA